MNFVAMDTAAAYGAFLAGEAVCDAGRSGGRFKMLAESDKYIPVVAVHMADSGHD